MNKISKEKRYVMIEDSTREVFPVFFSDDGVLIVFKLFEGRDWDAIWLDSYGRSLTGTKAQYI